jgi:hypothetical protein
MTRRVLERLTPDAATVHAEPEEALTNPLVEAVLSGLCGTAETASTFPPAHLSHSAEMSSLAWHVAWLEAGHEHWWVREQRWHEEGRWL